MKLVPYNGVVGPRYKSDNYKLLTEFAESGAEIMEVVDFKHSEAYGCTSSLKKSIERYRFAGIWAITRQNRVFLIRTDNKKE